MQKKIVFFMVALIALPVILSICISVLGGVTSVLQLFVNHPVYFIPFIALLIIAIIGLSLYTIKRNYTPLSPDSKSSFWQILTNIFLVFFTFWMGIFVQDLIASKNEAISNKMITFEYIDRIHPDYKKIVYNDFISRFGVYADLKKQYSNKLTEDNKMLLKDYQYADTCKLDSIILNRCDLKMSLYLLNNKDEIIRKSKEHDSIMAEYKYYLNKEMFDSISNMNQMRIIWLAIIDLLDDSTKLDNIQYSALVESKGNNDTSSYAREMSYFENAFTTQYSMHSGMVIQNYEFLINKSIHLYHLTKDGKNLSLGFSTTKDSLFSMIDSIMALAPIEQIVVDSLRNSDVNLLLSIYSHPCHSQIVLLKELAQYLVLDGMIMTNEMKLLRNASLSPLDKLLNPVLNPVAIFFVFLVLTFIASAIIVRVISPRKVKPVVTKQVYDELRKKCDDLNAIIRQKEIELNRKRKECKDADSKVKDLEEIIQERNKKISDLESAIHE